MTITLEVTPRDISTTTQTLRADGKVPAVIYGPKQEPTSVVLDAKGFDKVMREAGESTIIEVLGLASAIEVLIKDVDFDPIKQQIMHVDFYAIERGKEMTVHVPLHFIGEAPVEQVREGSVTKVLHEVEVTCRPSNLPSHIDVDVSVLATVEDKIHVSDLNVSEGVKIEADPGETVAVVSVAQEESEEGSTEMDMDSIEVVQKGKQEGGEAEKSE